jgi:cytochrome P450
MSGAAAATSDFRFDPADPGLIRDPYPVYARLRADPALHWAAGGYWVASRYADVREVLSNPRFGQGEFVRNIQLFYPPGFDVLAQSAFRWLSEVFVMQDPPHHTRLRKLVTHALTPKRIADMQPRIETITRSLLDKVVPRGRMEVLSDFAYQLPTLVMCDMLGVEEEQRTPERMAALTRAVADAFIVFETRALTADELQLANSQMDFLYDYFGGVFDRRAADPRGDLTSALAVPAADGDRLSRRELITVVIAMFGAGFETTAHMIGNGLLTLHTHTDQWAKLVADPTLSTNVVEEVLRYESSLQASYRTALNDAEVNGKPVKSGQRVLCVVGSANRDLRHQPQGQPHAVLRRRHSPLRRPAARPLGRPSGVRSVGENPAGHEGGCGQRAMAARISVPRFEAAQRELVAGRTALISAPSWPETPGCWP